MKCRTYFVGVVLSLCLAVTVWAADPQIYFSRKDPVAKVLVREINAAQRSIHVLMYSFTDKELAEALVAATKRGVDVRVVIDRNQSSERNSVSGVLREQLGPQRVVFRTGRGRGVMHQKMAIYDGLTVTLGSYNWTANAKANNWENMIVFRDAKVAAECLAEFQRVWESPEPKPPKPKTETATTPVKKSNPTSTPTSKSEPAGQSGAKSPTPKR